MAEGVFLSEEVLSKHDGPIGPIQLRGGIRTGTGPIFDNFVYHPDRIVFGGIEREARVLPASWALSPQSPAAGFSNGFAYLVLPQGVTTDLYFTIEIEEWWLTSTLGIYMEWANLHSATGNVRWEYEFKECDIGTERLDQSDVVESRAVTASAPPVNGGTTTSVCFQDAAGFPVTMNPGPIGSFYSLRISRIGGDAADTLAGDVGFIATNYTRGQ